MPKGANMFSKMIQNDLPHQKVIPKEGEVYKVVNTFGKTFEIRYGYYEECDRHSPLAESPVPMYPDFIKEPVYTDEGTPFVTMMQDACVSYRGESKKTPDTTCAECKYFQRGEDWFGICKCSENKVRKNE